MLILARIVFLKEFSWEVLLKAFFPKGRIVADFEAVQRHRRWIRTGRPLSLLFRLFSELLLFGHLSSILQNVDSVEIFKKHDNKHSYVHLSYFLSELYTFAEFGFLNNLQ